MPSHTGTPQSHRISHSYPATQQVPASLPLWTAHTCPLSPHKPPQSLGEGSGELALLKGGIEEHRAVALPILTPIICPGSLFLRAHPHPQSSSWTPLSIPQVQTGTVGWGESV